MVIQLSVFFYAFPIVRHHPLDYAVSETATPGPA